MVQESAGHEGEVAQHARVVDENLLNLRPNVALAHHKLRSPGKSLLREREKQMKEKEGRNQEIRRFQVSKGPRKSKKIMNEDCV